MSQLLQDAILGTDLDGGGFNIPNVASMVPAPSNLVDTADPRLSDTRTPADGSVTNAKVASGAGITQDKLSLNGTIPAPWLGSTAGLAAPGDLAEYLAKKGQPNGYAGLDATGKVPAAQMPVGAGTGTVTSVGLTMPTSFGVTGSPITGAGVLAVAWASVPAATWFGNPGGTPAAPAFVNGPLPLALIPNLPASQITSGTFLAILLPVAVGLGVGHAKGAVPDPGDGTGGALATDYLARDMTYKPSPAALIDDTAYGPSWNGVVGIGPSKNALYDWAHSIDTNDNGKVNVLDQGAGIPVTNSSGVLLTPMAAPVSGLVGLIDAQILQSKRVVPREAFITVAAQPAINTDTLDVAFINGLNLNITSMSANLTGSPEDYELLKVVFLDDGTPRTIAWGTSFTASGAALPTTTVAGKFLTVFFMFRVGVWACYLVDHQP